MVINDQTITSLVINLSQTKWSPDGQVSNVEFISCHIQVSWFWKTKLSGGFSKWYFLVFWLAIESESVSLKNQPSPDQSVSTKIPSTNETPLGLVFTEIKNFFKQFLWYLRFLNFSENYGDFDTFLLVYNIHVPVFCHLSPFVTIGWQLVINGWQSDWIFQLEFLQMFGLPLKPQNLIFLHNWI